MSFEIKAEETKSDLGRVGEGTYMARVVSVIDLGKHQRKNWKTQEVELDKHNNPIIDRMLLVNFELPTERVVIGEDDKPRWLTKEYKLSFFEKSALTGLINAVSNGEQLKTLDQMIDRTCMVQVGTTSGGKDKVVAVSPMLKGMEVPELQNPTKVFDIDDPDLEVWKVLPNFIKEKIKASENFAESDLAAKIADLNEPEEEDIPF